MANLKDLVVDGVLHQDKYTGTTYQYETNSLTIVGHNGETGKNSKRYIVRCSVCSDDKELHGEGYFISLKGHLDRGTKPCGCSIKCNWTEDQYKVRLHRACKERGIIFKGWSTPFTTANKTGVMLSCPDHGDYGSWKLSGVLSPAFENGCPGCFAVRMGDFKRKDDQDMIDTFMSSGGFAEGTIFRRSDRLDKNGHKKYWFVYCPECDTEGEAHVVGFYKGSRCCACAIGRPQETYINLLNDGDNTVAIKFGVANLALERVKRQNTRSVFDIVNYGVWKYEDVISCRSAERECLKTLPTGVVSKRDMSDGYTETTTVAHLEQVIYIFEKNGGVRV